MENRQYFRRFAGNTDGASAVEFALVSIPFILVIGAIFQLCLINWASQNLDESLQKAARTIYTGNFQAANKSQRSSDALIQSLKDSICGAAAPNSGRVFGCSDLKIDVATSTSFAASKSATAFDEQTGTWSKDFGTKYTCAKPGDIVVITAALKYPVAFRFLNIGFASFGDGSRLIMSTVVMQTEPYDTSSGSACS
ncbi:MAG: pilus assembly protein [Hymenobacter sp.]|nr:MAG: pilus assembly protein [Hymenobacter sp.]